MEVALHNTQTGIKIKFKVKKWTTRHVHRWEIGNNDNEKLWILQKGTFKVSDDLIIRMVDFFFNRAIMIKHNESNDLDKMKRRNLY